MTLFCEQQLVLKWFTKRKKHITFRSQGFQEDMRLLKQIQLQKYRKKNRNCKISAPLSSIYAENLIKNFNVSQYCIIQLNQNLRFATTHEFY